MTVGPSPLPHLSSYNQKYEAKKNEMAVISTSLVMFNITKNLSDTVTEFTTSNDKHEPQQHSSQID